MKFKLMALIAIFSFGALANTSNGLIIHENIEVVQDDESLENPRVKVVDVKNLIQSLGDENTCLDEYLKRRKQLITKLSLSPLTVVGGTYVSLWAGAVAGLGVAVVTNATGWDPLIYVAYGALAGFTVTGAATLTDTNIAAFQLADIDTIMKAITEQYLNREGRKSEKLYSRYLKKNENPVSKEVFSNKLLEMDKNGQLCDGTLTQKNSKKLKKLIARTKHLRSSI